MRRILLVLLLIPLLLLPVQAEEISAPQVPESGEALMPVPTESFGNDLWQLFKKAVGTLEPELKDAAGICLCLIATVMLAAILRTAQGNIGKATEFACVVAVCTLLLGTTNSLIQTGADTVWELSQYGKLLLPVMTAMLATQGGIGTSAGLYSGTALFDAVLSGLIAKLLIPLIYLYLVLAVGEHTTAEESLKRIKGFVKWLITWSLKTILYVFTGYIGLTGVISGSADAAALKATKLTISGMVPVVGGILSDASEAVIVGAQVMKSVAGIYGVLALLAIWIAPFLRIGAHYLLLKLTAAVCEAFGIKRASGIIKDFSVAMGLLVGMTASVCIMFLVSTVCFMKGVA